MALMEAMALGLPVVATAVGGVAETLTDGADAVLVPPSDHHAPAAGGLRLATDITARARIAAASAGSFGEGALYDCPVETLIDVEQRRLDTIAPERVDLVKIDVEGWERNVLRGAEQLPTQHPGCTIICRLNPDCLPATHASLTEIVADLAGGARAIWWCLRTTTPARGQVRSAQWTR